MIDVMSEWIALAIYWIVLAVWRALPVFAVVLLLERVLRKRFPARYLCVLWMIVVARLLLPISVESPLAVTQHCDNAFAAFFTSDNSAPIENPEIETFTFQREDGKTVVVRQPVLPIDASAAERKAAESNVVILEASSIQYHNSPTSAVANDYEDLYSVAAYAVVWSWLLGFLFLTIRGTFAYLRFSWRLRKQPVIEDQTIVDQVLRACDRVVVGRRPKIKEVKSLDTPAVFGLFRPVICLPSDWHKSLSGERLNWVLLHELSHIRRRDSLVMFVASVARALHWFHPLSWIVFTKLQDSIERAADEVATRDLSESSIREYGNLLLYYATGQTNARHQSTIGLLSMSLPRGLHGRIESLTTQVPKRPWYVRMAMVAVVASVAISSLTDAKTLEPSIEVSRSIPNIQVSLAGAELPTPQQTLAERNDPSTARAVSVNVERALQKARSLQPEVDAERFIKFYFGSYPMTAKQRSETTIVDGVMTLALSKQQEACMRQCLAAFEQSGPWQIATELRIIETDVRLLNQIDWSVEDSQTHCSRPELPPQVDDIEGWDAMFTKNASGLSPRSSSSSTFKQSASIPLRAAKISRLASERLLHQIQRDARSNIMQAPKVTMFNGQCAVISDVVQRPFVTDVSVVLGDLASAIQPEISVFESGWKFRIKPTATEDEKVALQLVLTHSSIDEVKLANLPRLAANQPEGDVTIQVPSVRSDSIAVASMLGADETLLVFSPKPYSRDEVDGVQASDRGKGLVFMIRTHLISDRDTLTDFVPVKSKD